MEHDYAAFARAIRSSIWLVTRSNRWREPSDEHGIFFKSVTGYKHQQRARYQDECSVPYIDNTDRYKGFIKSEALPVPSSQEITSSIIKQTRAIHAVDPHVNATIAPYIQRFEEELYQSLPTVKGKSPAEQCAIYERQRGNHRYCFVTDISAFDRSVHPRIRAIVTRQLARALGFNASILDLSVCTMRYWSFQDHGSVHSGERCTSLFAVLIITALQHIVRDRDGRHFDYLNCGDDNIVFTDDPSDGDAIIAEFNKFGLPARVEGFTTEPETVPFVARYWYYAPGGYRFAPDPNRLLGKLNITPEDRIDFTWFAAKCYCLLHEAHNCPVVHSFLRRGATWVPQSHSAINEYIMRSAPERARYYNKRITELLPPDDIDRAWFHRTFGMAPHDQLAVEHLVDSLDPPVVDDSVPPEQWPEPPYLSQHRLQEFLYNAYARTGVELNPISEEALFAKIRDYLPRGSAKSKRD